MTCIGEGGFGKVYQGTLADGTKVAVKILSRTSKEGYKEFQAEVTNTSLNFQTVLLILLSNFSMLHEN